MNTNDIRPGRNRFPYGDRHDMGISLERVVGSAEIPGTTEGEDYVAITLHKSYYEWASTPVPMGDFGNGERTIYINTSLFDDGLITIRLGEAFSAAQSGTGANLYGRVAGVIGRQGLIGLFSWRIGQGMIEWFPDQALTVFDSVLTAEVINGTSWGGASAYAAATTGAPLYYFIWDATSQKLAEPVRRVIPTDSGPSPFPASETYFGVFVPVTGGVAGSPLPAVYLGFDSTITSCAGSVSAQDAGIESKSDDSALVGSAVIDGIAEWGPVGGYSRDALLGAAGARFAYYEEFPTVVSLGHTAGYLFNGWYNPTLAIDDPAQNSNRVFFDSTSFIHFVHSLGDYLGFSGTAESPETIYLQLNPVEGAEPSEAAQLVFSISDTEATGAGESSAKLASGYTSSEGIKYCSGILYTSMWITMYRIKVIKYNTLSNGSVAGQLMHWDEVAAKWTAGAVGATGGQLLTWNATTNRWTAALAGTATGQVLKWIGGTTGWSAGIGVPDGTAAGQLLSWDNTAKQWVAGLLGTATGQVLQWNGTGWTAAMGSMPPGADKNTMFYDGTTGWTANTALKWDKIVNGTAASTGGGVLIDLTGCLPRAWDAAMPGIAITHPSGGTCGVFANIESGANGGARLDMGWGGANGGNFELYANTHPTRPGEFRIIYGPNGHIEFKKYVAGTDWRVTSGLSKEGRFFCGFNDAQFPGVTGNVGTNVAPAFPFQVFNETSQDSKVVAGVSKEGRGFFGCLGNPATGLPAFPLEIYNESGATASSRVAGISKNGRAFFGVSGSTAPTPQHPLEVYNEAGSTAAARKMYVTKDGKIVTSATVSSIAHTAQLDCNDIAMTTGATAQTVKLREMVIPYKSGTAVKGKLAQVMCGAGYGDELDLGGRPAAPTASAVRGSSTETDLSGTTAYDPASPEAGKDGLTIYVSLGSFYDHTSGTPVLKEYRAALVWPNAIAPKLAQVHTVEIDTPELP